MDNIKFKNMCRTCMSTLDLLLIQDNCKIDVLQFLTGSGYSEIDELPQKLCLNCIETMNNIQLFKSKCQQTHLSLTKYLINFKKNKTDDDILEHPIKEEFDNIIETNLDNDQNINTDVKEIINKPEVSFDNTRPEYIDVPNNIELVTEHFMKEEIIFEQMTVKEEVRNEEPVEHTKTNLKKILKKRLYQCNICKKNFKLKIKLNQHKKIHERRYECDVCLKSFKFSYNLIRHKVLHSGERPYKCDICNKSFSLKHVLVRHKLIHTDERRFECDVCRKGFKYLSHYTQHKILHSGDRPYECDICHKTFSHNYYLVRHKMAHSDERQFKCDICFKSFKISYNLIRHKKTHSGERPYQCEVCNKAFSLKYVLVRHQAIHSEQRLLKCDVCNKIFSTLNDLNKHRLKIHGKNN